MNKLFAIVCGVAFLAGVKAQCGSASMGCGMAVGGGCLGGQVGCAPPMGGGVACAPAQPCLSVPAPQPIPQPIPQPQPQPIPQPTPIPYTPPPTPPPFVQQPVPQPAPQPAPLCDQPIPVQNSCGGGCLGGGGAQFIPQGSMGCSNSLGCATVSSQCSACQTQRRLLRFYTRRHTRDANNETISVKEPAYTLNTSQVDDPVCNSDKLRAIINRHMSTNAAKAKKAIYNAAVNQFGGHYGVICSVSTFEFIADSHQYCLHGNGNMTCYAFQSQKSSVRPLK